MTDTASDLRRSCERLDRENARLKEQLAAQKRRADSLAQTVSHLRKEMEEARKKFEDELAKRDATKKQELSRPTMAPTPECLHHVLR